MVFRDITPDGTTRLTGNVPQSYISSRYRSTAQTIETGVSTRVSFDSNFQSNGFEYSGGVWTLPRTGRYLANSVLQYAGNATGSRYFRFLLNGVSLRRFGSGTAAAESSEHLSGSMTFLGTAGQQFEVQFYQSSGGNLNLFGDTNRNTATDITYLGL